MLPAFEQGFVDIAFIQLGVAGDRHMPRARLLGIYQTLRPQIILHQGSKTGQRDAQPNRSGREINFRAILGPGRIGLRAAHLPKCRHLLDTLAAEQIIDRMQHRPGMRLYRHPVIGAQNLEIQRRHDRDYRGAARLMPAHLHPIPVRPDMIGVMDHPGG